MERFYGFDLGDAESAVAVLNHKDTKKPQVIRVGGASSFITAYARTSTGQLLIGENACYQADVVKRRLRFKSRFLSQKDAADDIKAFAGGVLGQLCEADPKVTDENSCFYVGCPAGWDGNARERYRAAFEQAGYPPVRMISESRAALVCACQSKHLQVGYDILSKPVLVIDIGSSTTDFAYICGGKEVQMQTAGEVALGGGLMDEALLALAVERAQQAQQIKEVFEKSEPWRNYCEFAARRLKEQYYTDPEYYKEHPCTRTIMVRFDKPYLLTLSMDAQTAQFLTDGPLKSLGGRSFKEMFMEALASVQKRIEGEQPQLVFLTGGVSRMEQIRDWCIESFPSAIIITGTEPEYAVARGLAWSGRIDEELRLFRKELDELIESTVVEDIVRARIPNLYREVVDALVMPILENAALPVFLRWREGQIRTLADTEPAMRKEIEAYLKTDEARALMAAPIARWLRPVSAALEEYTVPICVRHDVPHTALSLNTYLTSSDIDVQIDAKNVFAVEEVTWLIDSVITIVVSLLCGGSGVALISSGPTGIIAGAIVSMLVLGLGKNQMESALLKANLPVPVRKLVPKNSFKARMNTMADSVRENLYENMEGEKNEQITARMTDQIAQQIEQCLLKMAQVVEIPLG